MNLEKENVRMACLKPKDKLEFKFSPSPPTHVVFGMYRVKTKLTRIAEKRFLTGLPRGYFF